MTILIDDLINDSISYCACVIVKISDDFYDDRHENRLVEIRLYTVIQTKEEIGKNEVITVAQLNIDN